MGRRRVALFVVLAVGGLLLVALPAALAGGGGGCHAGEHTQADTTTVNMKRNCFTPTVTTVDAGDTVEFNNGDPIAHAIAGATGDWGTKDLSGKQSATVEFDEPGVYPYWCPYHMGMIGAVMVGDGRMDSKAAGNAPVAVAVEPQKPPSGGSQATGEPASARVADEGIAPVAVVAIALVAGVGGYGFAIVVRRRDLAVPAEQSG